MQKPPRSCCACCCSTGGETRPSLHGKKRWRRGAGRPQLPRTQGRYGGMKGADVHSESGQGEGQLHREPRWRTHCNLEARGPPLPPRRGSPKDKKRRMNPLLSKTTQKDIGGRGSTNSWAMVNTKLLALAAVGIQSAAAFSSTTVGQVLYSLLTVPWSLARQFRPRMGLHRECSLAACPLPERWWQCGWNGLQERTDTAAGHNSVHKLAVFFWWWPPLRALFSSTRTRAACTWLL